MIDKDTYVLSMLFAMLASAAATAIIFCLCHNSEPRVEYVIDDPYMVAELMKGPPYQEDLKQQLSNLMND